MKETEEKNPFDITELDLNEVFFTELEVNEEKKYAFRFLNWQTPVSRSNGGVIYWIFEAISLSEYPENQLYDGQLFRLHLPHTSFKHALIKFLAYHRIGTKLQEFKQRRDVVIDVVFTRSNKKVIEILSVKYVEVAGSDSENILFQAEKNGLPWVNPDTGNAL